jgi:hypothetical protein
MENRSEQAVSMGGEEEARARISEPYSPSRATTPHTEDDMDVDILDYEEDEEAESAEEDLLADLLDDDDWSGNLGGVKEMFNPDGGNPTGVAVGITPHSTEPSARVAVCSTGEHESEEKETSGNKVTV